MNSRRTLAATLTATLCALGLPAQPPNATVYFTEGISTTPLSAGSASFAGVDVFSILDNTTTQRLGIGIDRARCDLYVPTSTQFAAAIERVSTNGTGRQTIRSFSASEGPPQGITVDTVGERIYWFGGSGATRIGACDLDGNNAVTLVGFNATQPRVRPWALQVDRANNRLYWYDAGGSCFRRCNLDGSQIENLLAPGTVWSADIDVVNGDFYWTRNDELCRAPIDGSAPPAVVLNDPAVFLPSIGKYVDVEPALDLITWVVSGGRIHWTSLSSPGVIQEIPTPPGTIPNGSLEVMPGPRVGLAIQPAVIPPGGSTTFDVCGVIPNGPFALFVASVNGTPFPVFLFGALADADGRFSLPATFNPAVTNLAFTFDLAAVDPTSRIVWTLPAPLTFL